MASSDYLKKATQEILNDIEKILPKQLDTQTDQQKQPDPQTDYLTKIKEEIRRCDYKGAGVVILKKQLGDVLTNYWKNLADPGAQKKKQWYSRGSSSKNPVDDTQIKKDIEEDLGRIAGKAKGLMELTKLDVDDSLELIGREKEMKKIIDELIELVSKRQQARTNVPPVPVIIIAGLSGIGKTELARHICKDKNIKSCVGLDTLVNRTQYNTFDATLTDYIATCVDRDTTKSSGNRIVVLDDWNVEIRDEDVKALQKKLEEVDLCLTAIMITTRSSLVSKAKNINATLVKSYSLSRLDEKQSLDLFKKTGGLGADTNSSTKQVLEHCRGVPRAIKILAKWQNSDRCKITTFTEELIHSYYDERLPHLCFAYCSLFPLDYEFDAERLIHLWNQEPGKEVGDYLGGRSIFEEVEVDEFGEVRSFRKMHPLMHDIARFMADWKDITMDQEGSNVHRQVQRASFVLCSENKFEIPDPLFDKAKELKSLVLLREKSRMQMGLPTKVLEKVLQSFKKLSVLDLRQLLIMAVPDSIGELKELKYLDLSKNKMEMLPSSITKLCNLETLKLFYCYLLKELPGDFKHLSRLKHLDMRGCINLTGMPTGIGMMSSLETLSAFVASEGKKGLEELTALEKLKGHLEILHLERVTDAPDGTKYLENKHLLEGLTLKWDLATDKTKGEKYLKTLDCLNPNPALRVLIIADYPGPNLSRWLTSTSIPLESLVKLRLQGCYGCKYLSEQDQLPPNLMILELVRLHSLECIITKNCGKEAAFYKSLEKLTVRDCPRLKSWWLTEQDWPTFPNISKLDVCRCPRLPGSFSSSS